MRVMGVDLSSRSLACYWFGNDQGPDGAVKLKIPDKVKDRQQIASGLFHEAWDRFHMGPATVVYIEEPVVAGARNIRSSLLIAQICGVMMGVCASVGIKEVYLVPVSSWKKEVVGNGAADKQRVHAWIDQNHPEIAALCGGDQDLYDAACVAIYGQRSLSRVDGIRSELSHGA